MLDGVLEADDTEVYTIDNFQCRKADAIILSMVRSESNHYNHSFNDSISCFQHYFNKLFKIVIAIYKHLYIKCLYNNRLIKLFR